MTYHKAIYTLYPNAVIIKDGIGAFDSDGVEVQIDETLVQAEVARLEAEWNATEYQRLRAAEYPPITNYIDGVVKGDQAQIQQYIDECLAVKAKYPKGTS